ncbi:MAG: hypothetical protein KDB22_26775 [Planctomycetales bacterium]|nr:hypothetical protein [Planctomycetales bacterium]
MARPLVFQFGDTEFALAMSKVDRSKLYGSKELEVVDEADQPCELATLADDGRTLIGRGGTGLGWIDVDGKWRAKSELKPINVEGDVITPVASSFGQTLKLFETVTADEFLDHNIRLVYSLSLDVTSDGAAGGSLAELRRELERGAIFTFPYSYRGGLESDTAFILLSESGEIMMAVGTRAEVSFVGIQTQVVEETELDADDDQDLLDFDMI